MTVDELRQLQHLNPVVATLAIALLRGESYDNTADDLEKLMSHVTDVQNALPHLLDIAEAAQRIDKANYEDDDYEAYDELREALVRLEEMNGNDR